MATAAILGASGFSGQETLDRVLSHPQLDLLCLGSDSLAGRSATSLDPRLARDGAASVPTFVSNAEAAASGADVVFACLPHEEAAALVPPEGGVVVEKVRTSGPGEGLNAANGEYVDLFRAGVVDAAKVTRSALQNAASIAALFLTTEAIVADKPEKAPAMPGGMPGGGDMDF